MASASGPAPAVNEASEEEIKAAFVCKFGNYVEWPGVAAPAERAGFAIAVAGSEAETDVLQRIAVGASVEGRTIRVRRLGPGETLQNEQILYVTHAQTARVAELSGAAREHGVLVVTEASPPAERAGMVNFIVADNKVRFDIDLSEIGAAHLKVSGRLLSVARKVTGGS
jgi:hypothetical protein